MQKTLSNFNKKHITNATCVITLPFNWSFNCIFLHLKLSPAAPNRWSARCVTCPTLGRWVSGCHCRMVIASASQRQQHGSMRAQPSSRSLWPMDGSPLGSSAMDLTIKNAGVAAIATTKGSSNPGSNIARVSRFHKWILYRSCRLGGVWSCVCVCVCMCSHVCGQGWGRNIHYIKTSRWFSLTIFQQDRWSAKK